MNRVLWADNSASKFTLNMAMLRVKYGQENGNVYTGTDHEDPEGQ